MHFISATPGRGKLWREGTFWLDTKWPVTKKKPRIVIISIDWHWSTDPGGDGEHGSGNIVDVPIFTCLPDKPSKCQNCTQQCVTMGNNCHIPHPILKPPMENILSGCDQDSVKVSVSFHVEVEGWFENHFDQAIRAHKRLPREKWRLL